MTTILSWTQLVQEADPNWRYASLNPVMLEFSSGRRFRDPNPLYAPLPASGLENNGGVLQLTDATGWPTSPDGLPPGAVWANWLWIGVVPGLSPPVQVSPLYYGQVTASQILLWGAGKIGTTEPTAGSLQIWINGDILCVA